MNNLLKNRNVLLLSSNQNSQLQREQHAGCLLHEKSLTDGVRDDYDLF